MIASKGFPTVRITRMACPICIGGSLDRSTKPNCRRYMFVDMDEYLDAGGKVPEKHLEITGVTWRAFSLLGISLIFIWQ